MSWKSVRPALVTLAVAVATAATLWFVSEQLRSSWLLFGAHPEVTLQLEGSLQAYRALAELGSPEDAASARQQFERANQLLQRLKILELSRGAMLERLRYGLLAVLVASIALLSVLVTARQRSLRRRMRHLRQGLELALHGEQAVFIDDASDDLLGRIGRVVSRISEQAARERSRRKSLEFLDHWQAGARLVAHEMKTPITSLRLDLAALEKANNDDRSRVILERANEGLQGLEDFVQRYTEMARLPVPAPRFGCLGSFVSSFVEQFDAAWPHVSLRFEPGADPAECSFDPEATRRVLHNLVENSARAMQEAGRSAESPGTVDFKLVVGTRGLDLLVEDDGPGLTPEAAADLFTPYSTTDAQRGLGIGLAASRKMMFDQGGDLIHEPSSVGARFRVRFPVETDTSGDPARTLALTTHFQPETRR